MPTNMKRTPKKRKYTPVYVQGLTKRLIHWMNTSKTLWLGDFAKKNGMHRARFGEIEDKEFQDAYELAKQAQENWLVTGGLNETLNSTMVIFSLKNVAGWRDKSEVEQKTETKTDVNITVKFEGLDQRQLTDFLLDRNYGHPAKLN